MNPLRHWYMHCIHHWNGLGHMEISLASILMQNKWVNLWLKNLFKIVFIPWCWLAERATRQASNWKHTPSSDQQYILSQVQWLYFDGASSYNGILQHVLSDDVCSLIFSMFNFKLHFVYIICIPLYIISSIIS